MENNSLRGFTWLLGLAEATGTVCVIFVAVWLGSYKGGFSWSSTPSLEFNWHPLLMSVGMIFLYGNGILIYRVYRNVRKTKLKIIHAGFNLFALILMIIGLQAVFDSHNLSSPPKPNLQTLHSWMGLTCVILFAFQWLFGFISFFCPGVNTLLKSMYLSIHVLFGLGIFMGGSCTALMGLSEKSTFDLSSEGVLINFIGISIIVYSSLVVYLASQTKYKRHPLPEDEMLLG